jgi:fucose 4-O-acetylase-like acetyltransferase
MSVGDSFWENPVHIFICSFHMPIFMLISGFFFDHVLGKRIDETIKKKFLQLIVPCFGWSFILVLIQSLQMIHHGEFISLFTQIKQLLYETGTRFWFLRSVFICYVLAAISMKLFKYDYIACPVSILLFLLMTDNFRLALDKFMFPYFWAGYFIHKRIDWIDKYKKTLTGLSFILFIILLTFWKKENYIYQTGMSFYTIQNLHITFIPFFERLTIILYRYLIGFAGSLFFFLLLKQVFNPSIIIYQKFKVIGKYTLGIYLIHIFMTGFILTHLKITNMNLLIFNFTVTPLISLLLIVLCLFVIKLLQKNKLTTFLLLGK